MVQARGFAAIVSEKDGTLVVAAPPGGKINGIRDLADPERALSIVEQRDLAVMAVGQRDGPVMFSLWPKSP